MASDVETAFELKFAAGLRGAVSAKPETVVLRRLDMLGPGGHPIYSDISGIVRAEISDRFEVRMLATSSRQVLRRPVSCRPVALRQAAAASAAASATTEAGTDSLR
ncbi:DUF6296 family protein [Streptacidiphilus sp. PAMC 29251]